MNTTTPHLADAFVNSNGRNFRHIGQQWSEGRIVCLWAVRCGLGTNPTKTELMLSTTRTKVHKFHLPRLSKQRLVLFSNVNYLGVILDKKLN